MQRLEVSGAVRPLQGSIGVKGLNIVTNFSWNKFLHTQTVNTLAHTKDDTAAVTIKASHCYYIITFRKTSEAD